MAAIREGYRKERELQEIQRMELEVKPYLESIVGERFITSEQKTVLVEFCGCKDEQGRLVKTPKAINKILTACGIDYEIKTKRTNKRVEGKVVAVNYWVIEQIK